MGEGSDRICSAGISCEFCHLCPPGELARRKKSESKSRKSNIHDLTLDLTTAPRDSGLTFVPAVGLVQDDIWEKARRLSQGDISPKRESGMEKNMVYVAGVGLVKDVTLNKSNL